MEFLRLLACSLVALVAFLVCNGATVKKVSSAHKPNSDEAEVEQNSPDTDSDRIQGLVNQLNEWDAIELIAYNEPERFPNYLTSGETNGWITTHQEKLSKLGVQIAWDKTKQEYVIVAGLIVLHCLNGGDNGSLFSFDA